jgi:hypothetical protein
MPLRIRLSSVLAHRVASHLDPHCTPYREWTKIQRRPVLDGIRKHLLENDPSEMSRNKFALRRPSPHAERELRFKNWRIFYTMEQGGGSVLINLIGEKKNNRWSSKMTSMK